MNKKRTQEEIRARFQEIVDEHCDGSPHITGVRAGIYKRVEVSIGTHLTEENQEGAGKVEKKIAAELTRDLKKSFPDRKIIIDVGPSEGKLTALEDCEPFQKEKIIYVTIRPYKVVIKP